MKIFIGPVEIAGYYTNLYHGLEEEGYDVSFITFCGHPFNYEIHNESKFKVHLNHVCELKKKWKFGLNIILRIYHQLLIFIVFCLAIIKYDVFIFGFGKSLLRWNIDLPVLRILRKKIIVNISHGSEARPPYLSGAGTRKNGRKVSISSLYKRTKIIRAKIWWIEKFASYIIGAPYSSTQLASRPQINTFSIGLPVNVAYEPNFKTKNTSRSVIILHAPSNPTAKGTMEIRSSIESLINEGFDINYKELVGVSHQKVVDELCKCDFVVDQLYSDTRLAGFASEAAFFGKPAIVGGYRLKELEEFLPRDMIPPSYLCHPSNLEDSIKKLILDEKLRLELGEKARKFVKGKWSATAVAKRYIDLINDDISDFSWIVPEKVNYVHGAGLRESEIKTNVQALCREYGKNSLCLEHNPVLEKKLFDFS